MRGSGRSLQVVVAMVGWWVAVVTPTALVVLGVFEVEGEVGDGVRIPADLTIVWIVSYLAQLALILLLVKPVGHLETWWIFIASLLPWAVNWGSPYGLGIAVVAMAGSAAVAGVIAVLALRSIRLDEHGRRVWATVVREVPSRFTTVVNNIYVRRRIELDIPRGDGSTYRGVVPMLCEIGTRPAPGDRYELRVDPDKPTHVALASSVDSDA